MQNINNVVQNFLHKHKNNQRYLFVLILLSVMVIVIVCSSLITPAVSMTGKLNCQKEQHTHSEECYAETLICTEDTNGHQHSDECYTTAMVISCGLEEDETHTHSEECYTEEKVLDCNIPEKEPHVHTNECYEKELICSKEEHTHTDECYDTPPAETENIKEAEKDAEENPDEIQNEPDVVTVDPIDAEQDKLLSSFKTRLKASTYYTYSVNGNVTVIDSVSVDFGEFIKNVTHQDVANASSDKDVKTVKFTISYNLPANTLMNGNDNRQIHCLLPDNVTIPELRTGIVRKEGQEIGTYKITDDGYIIIEFDQNFVKDGGTIINGDISFNANVHKTNEDSEYETVTIGSVSVNVPFPNNAVPQNDLSVEKTYAGYDRDSKKVSYKLEIKSSNGSGEGEINVTDMLYYTDSELIHLDWADGDTAVFTKKSADGNTSEVTGTVSVSDDGTVSITGLPALEANESYSIEYTATLTPDDKTQIIKTNNKAVVSNGTLTDESIYYGETAVSCGITKKGQYNDRTDRVEWSINVTNPFGDLLDGYTISDDMLGLTVSGIKVKDGSGNVIETLDESNSFSGTTGTLDKDTNTFAFNSGISGTSYTLYYETELPDRNAIANNTVSNKAVLKSAGQELNAPSADAYISADRQSVDKYYRSASYDSDNNVIIDWYAALDFQIGDFNGNTYSDTMISDENYHYMTAAQVQSIRVVGYKPDNTEVSLVSGTDYSLVLYDIDGNELTDLTADDVKIYSFDITFADNDTISQLSDVDIYYTCTGIASDMIAGTSRTYTNKAEFLSVSKSASYTENKKKPFEKYDSMQTGSQETQHSTDDLDKTENGANLLKWYIEANETGYYKADEDAVFTDTLPLGVSLEDSYVYYGDWLNGSYSRIEDSGMTYTVSSDANGQQTVVFTIPGSLHGGNKFRIEYAVSIDEGYLSKNKDAQGMVKFKNTVTDGTFSSEQTQKVESIIIRKSASDPDDVIDGYIDYIVDVNPEAETLSNNGIITVTDTMNFQWNSFVPTLKRISVYSVTVDSDGNETLTELDPSSYKLSYSNDGLEAKFTAELPDKTHLKIKYMYRCIYKDPDSSDWKSYWEDSNGEIHYYNGANIYNSVSLEHDNSVSKASHQDKYFLQKESEASADTDDYIQIRKVDAENYGVKLKGAEFSLYKWDGSAWLPVTDIDTDTNPGQIAAIWGGEEDTPYAFATDEEGKALLPELESKVVYKLVELKAPDKYIKSADPFYFAEGSSPSTLPDDVKADEVTLLLKGGVITIPNKLMQTTEVEVQKFWHDPPDFSGTHDEVEVELFQSKTDPSGKVDGPEITFNFSDNEDNHITKSFNVKYGDDLVIDIRTFMAWYKSYPLIYLTKNGVTEEVNIFNNKVEGFLWTPNVNYSWFTERPDGWQNNEDCYSTYTLGFSNVTADMVWDITFDDARAISDYAVFIGNEEMGVPVTGIPDDAVSVGTAILNSSNDWTKIWDDIPATDEYGYNYYYYVRENTTVTSYNPSYDNNGVNKGVIYITNKGEGYTNEMPKTGGTGNKPMVITGIIIISGSSAFYLLSNRRRKRRQRF